jgi:hypothetical protein
LQPENFSKKSLTAHRFHDDLVHGAVLVFRRSSFMPLRPWPLWLLTWALIIGFPVVNWVYWPQVLYSGVLSPDSDSIGIPMFNSILVSVILMPFILTLAWICLRNLVGFLGDVIAVCVVQLRHC